MIKRTPISENSPEWNMPLDFKGKTIYVRDCIEAYLFVKGIIDTCKLSESKESIISLKYVDGELTILSCGESLNDKSARPIYFG